MKLRIKKTTLENSLKVAALIFITILIFLFGYMVGNMIIMRAEASTPKTGMYTTQTGTYIVKDGKVCKGWTRYKGKTYYCHETTTEMYPVGSIFKGGMKLIDGKIYCFDSRGRQVRRDTRYIKLHRDRKRSVKNVYMPGTGHRRRYNTHEMRYQVKIRGRWHTEEGMAFYPYGMIDTQP